MGGGGLEPNRTTAKKRVPLQIYSLYGELNNLVAVHSSEIFVQGLV